MKTSTTAAVDHAVFEYYYKPHNTMSAEEKDSPIMLAWTTLPTVPGAHPPFSRHALRKSGGTLSAGAALALSRHAVTSVAASHQNSGPYDTVQVKVPFDPKPKWRQDNAIHFMLMTKTTNHDGQSTYASEATTEAYMADLVANPYKWFRLPARVGPYYMPSPGQDNPALVTAERHKGDVHVRLVSSHAPVWHAPMMTDLTPANQTIQQSVLMMGISTHMAPFEPTVVGQSLQATLPELKRIHAPIFVNATTRTPRGPAYFMWASYMARQQVMYHGGPEKAMAYYSTLLGYGLERHNMSQAEFIAAGARFAAASSGAPIAAARAKFGGAVNPGGLSDARLRKAVSVLATTCVMRVNMMRYTSDRAVLAQSKQVKAVESFDAVDNRTNQTQDEGGAESLDFGLYPTTATSSGAPMRFGIRKHHVHSVARSIASGGSMDCEDGAFDGAKVFLNLTDAGSGLPDVSSHALIKAAREIGYHYTAMAILCSVLSASLAEATGTANSGASVAMTDTPDIGSLQDRKIVPGAHMWLALLSKAQLAENVGRAFAASPGIGQARKASLDLGFGRPPKSPMRSGAHPPPAFAEGTGIINPMMRPEEANEPSLAGKLKVAIGALRISEAHLRLSSAMTSQDVEAAGNNAMVSPAPAVMNKFMPMHRQDRIIDNPKKRFVPTFYRTGAEFYGISTHAQLKAWLNPSAATKHASAQVFANHFMIPVNVPQTGGPSTWGVSISHLMGEQPNVGILPTPKPTLEEMMITQRVMEHLPPAVATHLGDQLGSSEYLTAAMRWPAMLKKQSGLESVAVAQARLGNRVNHPGHETVVIHTFAHPRDLRDADIPVLARWLKGNPHVVAANLTIERSTYHLATVRLDALVDVGDLSAGVTPALTKALVQRYPHLAPNRVRRVAATPATRARNASPRSKLGGSKLLIGAQSNVRDWPTLAHVPPNWMGRPLDISCDFTGVMEEHICLTIDYACASWQHHQNHQDADLPLTASTVQALLKQFKKWESGWNRFTMGEPKRRYNVVFSQLFDPVPIYDAWAPSEMWVTELIKHHTVFAKQLIDASWDDKRKKDKATAIKGITGLNRNRIAVFFKALIGDTESGDEAVALWDKHLGCTVAYTNALAKHGPDSASFLKETRNCISLGQALERSLNAALERAYKNS